MGFIAVIAVIYVLYKLIEEWLEPTQTGKFDWKTYNRDATSGQFNKKQLRKRMDRGMYHKDK